MKYLNENYYIKDTSTMKDVLLKLQENKKRFLICINIDNKVVGVLTDGDIRRALLKGYMIDAKVNTIYNPHFEYITSDSSFDEICTKFKSERIDILPIVDTHMKLINIITKKQFHIFLLENQNFNLKYDFTKFDNITLEHQIYNKPWGYYKSTILTSHAQAKVIVLFSKEELSLQEHKKREEHWVIIKGTGKVILGESIIDVYPGKYVYIPKGCKHQIINNSDENIIFSEVQLGEYFGEDDIIRHADKYNRT